MIIQEGKYYKAENNGMIVKSFETTDKSYFIGVVVVSALDNQPIGHIEKTWASCCFKICKYNETNEFFPIY